MMSERKILLIGVLIIAALVIMGLFAIDFYTQREILNETIVGMLIGGSFGWIGAYIAFYTTNSEDSK